VRALTDLGIDAEHISMFPSWEADVSALRSEEARRVWSHHRSYTADAREAGFSLEQILAVASSEYIDLSAGAWRVHLLADERAWPAVQPQHEVRKAWIPTRGSIVRFAGFARYGAAKRHRADRIAGAGFGPDPEWLEGGYLSTAFVDGTPCTRATPALLDRIADHVAFLVRAFPAGRSPDVPQLEEMIRTNIRIGLGENVHLPDLAGFRGPLANAPCAGIDGRMLPHEWIGAGGRYTKVDALDHHADHFYPGIQDAGWDLAATAFEFRLDHGGLGHLVSRYEAASGDGDIRARLPFYDLAYPAFRLGYATLARGSVDAREAGRFDGVITRCRARLRALAGITLPSAP
jgi:hypothetical protein